MKLLQTLALLFLCALAGMSRTVQAQTGIYGMFSYSHFSGEGVGYGVSAPKQGSDDPLGGTVGAYNDFVPLGPLHLGADGRFFLQNRGGDRPYGSKAVGGLFGLRLDVDGIPIPLHPYVQAEAGVVGANNGNSQTKNTGAAYQLQGGVDFSLLPHLALRVEYGGGVIAGGTIPSRTLEQLGVGLTLRL